MNELRIIAEEAQSILICGHKRPDGDCTGACIASYHYLKNIYPDKEIVAYLEVLPDRFAFMDEEEKIISHEVPKKPFDLVIALDSSTADCLGEAQNAFYQAKKTLCVDHHISNRSYAGQNFINANASSACEVLYEMMADEDIDEKIAEALYIGIIFDTGVFQHIPKDNGNCRKAYG